MHNINTMCEMVVHGKHACLYETSFNKENLSINSAANSTLFLAANQIVYTSCSPVHYGTEIWTVAKYLPCACFDEMLEHLGFDKNSLQFTCY